ncbi:unnamed protein product [Rotaria sp. Silwood2]|nr:unnamed protein product [Rotaria sp. Silwood2]
MLQSISAKIQAVIAELTSQELINKDTKEFSQQRDQFYNKLNEKLLILDEAKVLSKYAFGFNVNEAIEECFKSIAIKATDIHTNINKFLKSFVEEAGLTSKDYDFFNLYYNNLLSCRQEVKGAKFEINDKIDKIEKEIFDKIRMWEQLVEKESSIENISMSLINMKDVSNNIPSFNVKINQRIDEVLINHKNRTKITNAISRLGAILIQDLSCVTQSIIAEHKAFQGYALSLFNEKIQKHDIDHVLENLRSDCIDKSKLKTRYHEFEAIYKDLIQQNLKPNVELNQLILETKRIAGDIKQTSGNIIWNADVRNRITKLLARIFALWTLQSAHHYFEAQDVENKNTYLLKLHAAQVVSIFRMLSLGDKNEELKNNLVQIETGEGKSVTLGATALLLALLGFNVHCACYSDYLSQRDYNGFLKVFDTLGVTQNIRYGIFNKLYEEMIHRNEEIRQSVEQFISNGSNNIVSNSQLIERAKILLIDEVDVFFSQDFYGNVCTPSTSLRDPTITSLTNFIWTQRKSKLNLNQVKATPEYVACSNRFPNWEPLILEAVKSLIYDVISFESHNYIVKEDKIGYKE